MKLKSEFKVHFFCDWYSFKDSLLFPPHPPPVLLCNLGWEVSDVDQNKKKNDNKNVQLFRMRGGGVFFLHSVFWCGSSHWCRTVAWGTRRESCLNWHRSWKKCILNLGMFISLRQNFFMMWSSCFGCNLDGKYFGYFCIGQNFRLLSHADNRVG